MIFLDYISLQLDSPWFSRTFRITWTNVQLRCPVYKNCKSACRSKLQVSQVDEALHLPILSLIVGVFVSLLHSLEDAETLDHIILTWVSDCWLMCTKMYNYLLTWTCEVAVSFLSISTIIGKSTKSIDLFCISVSINSTYQRQWE